VDVVQDPFTNAGGWGGHTSVCRAQKTGPVDAAPGGVVDWRGDCRAEKSGDTTRGLNGRRGGLVGVVVAEVVGESPCVGPFVG
jgi:hypothetical protein